MKFHYSLMGLVCVLLCTIEHPVYSQFQNTYLHGFDHDHYSVAYRYDTLGGVYAGSMNVGGNWQIHLQDMDMNGVILNETLIGGANEDRALHINTAINGNGYVVCGQTKESGFDVGYVILVDNNLNVLNQRKLNVGIPNTHSTILNVIATTENPCNSDPINGYVLCGFIASGYGSTDSKQSFIMKLDANLNLVWQKFFNSPQGSNPNDWDMASHVVQVCAEQGYFVGGSGTSSDGDQAILAACVTYNGVLMWKKLYENTGGSGNSCVGADAAHDDAGGRECIYQLVNHSNNRNMGFVKMDDGTGVFDLSESYEMAVPGGDYYAYSFEALCNTATFNIAGYGLNQTSTTGSTTYTGTFAHVFTFDIIFNTVSGAVKYPTQSSNYTPSSLIIDTYSTTSHPRIFYPKMMDRRGVPFGGELLFATYENAGALDELHLLNTSGTLQSTCHYTPNTVLTSPYSPVVSPVDTLVQAITLSALVFPNQNINATVQGCIPPCPVNANFNTVDLGNCCFKFEDVTPDGPNSCNNFVITDLSNNIIYSNVADTITFCFNAFPPGQYIICHQDCYFIPGAVGCDNVVCDTIEVVCQPCVPSPADFSFIVNGCSVTFTDLTPEGNPDFCEKWVFGNAGQSFATDGASFTFPGSGTYTVCHYDCCRDPFTGQTYFTQVCKTITINCAPPCCAPTDFTVSGFLCCRTFTPVLPANCNANLTYLWSFGNSQTSTQQNPTVCYNGSGAYYVCLRTYCNGVLMNLICKQIRVRCAIIINPNPWGWNPVISSRSSGLSVVLTDSSNPDPSLQLVSREWDFGDGTFSAEISPEHYYQTGGQYEVVLQLVYENPTNGEVQTKTTSELVSINFSPPCNCAPSFPEAITSGELVCNSENSIQLKVRDDDHLANMTYEWYQLPCCCENCDDSFSADALGTPVGVGQNIWVHGVMGDEAYVCKCICNGTGTYTFTNILYVEYDYHPLSIQSNGPNVCSGSTANLVAIDDSAVSYSWFPSLQTTSSIQPLITSSQLIDVVAESASGCPSYAEVQLFATNCPINDERANAILRATNSYPACSSFTGNLLNATSSSNVYSIAPPGAGQDLWYRFTTNSSAVRIVGSSSVNDLVLELQTSNGDLVGIANGAGVGATEILVAQNLQIGQTYFLVVRNFNNANAGSFSFCIQSFETSDPDNGTFFNSLCGAFKCDWNGANVYSVTFDDGINQYTGSNGANSNIPFANFGNLRYGVTYNVVISSTFFVSGSNGMSTITLISPPYQVTIGNHLPVSLRATDRCPTLRSLSSFVSTDRWICGVSAWCWEFLEVDEDNNPVGIEDPSIIQTSNSSRFIRVNQIPGAAPGKRFRVRVRPTFTYGQGNYGPEEYLCIIGAVAMHGNNDENVVLRQRNHLTEDPEAVVYPNPSNGRCIFMNLTGWDEAVIKINVTDGLGKRVYQQNFDSRENKLVTIFFESKLSSGLYLIEMESATRNKVCRFIVE
ncbi:MAG: PKD domain-containing protein [Flavobacteriales bacterium]|jgi:hypothetical protein